MNALTYSWEAIAHVYCDLWGVAVEDRSSSPSRSNIERIVRVRQKVGSLRTDPYLIHVSLITPKHTSGSPSGFCDSC